MKTYQWKYKDVSGTNYYHDEEGKIHGEINRINFSDEIYSASLLYPDNDLGKYIDRKSAMKAVENQIDDPLYNLRKLWPQREEEEVPTFGLDVPDLKFDFTPPEDDLAMYNEQTYAQDANWPLDLDSTPSYTVSLSLPEEKPKKKKKK